MKLSNFAFVFLLFTSSLLISLISGLNPNPALETDAECQKDSDCVMMVENSHCNTNRKCQCNFPYAPMSEEVGILGVCRPKVCNYDGVCTELYRDLNTTCSKKRCACQEGFVFNEKRQQCEFGDPEIRALGAVCDHYEQCSRNANCRLDGGIGYCRCAFGYVPANNITCKPWPCLSDAQCRARTGPNSLCTQYSGAPQTQCVCELGYTDEFTGSCLPRARKIGESCHDLDPRYRCGDRAKCAGSVCRCQAGSFPMTTGYGYDCEHISCKVDSDCLAGDINSVCNGAGWCTCPYPFNLDATTQLCVKTWRLDSGWILGISFAAIVFVSTLLIVISKAVFGWKVPKFHD